MRLYKYRGDFGFVSHATKLELISSNVADVDEACTLIKGLESVLYYIRMMGPDMEDKDYYFDYGSYSEFYLLTDRVLNRGDKDGDNV